jgi:hypothetical protein
MPGVIHTPPHGSQQLLHAGTQKSLGTLHYWMIKKTSELSMFPTTQENHHLVSRVRSLSKPVSGTVLHAWNPNYSGARDPEDRGSRPAQAKS